MSETGVSITPSDQLTDDAAATLQEVVEHRTRRIWVRRTPAKGTPGTPDYQPPQEIETVTEERNVRVKLHDKVQALVNISKYLGLLQEREREAERPLLPKGFFAALVMGDVSRIQGFPSEDTVLEPTATPGTPNEAQCAKLKS